MIQRVLDFFKDQDVEIYRSFDISRISSIGIGGVADLAVYPNTEQQLLSVLAFLEENEIKYFIAGQMTNLLLCTDRYSGVIVLTDKMNGYCVAECGVRAECGAKFSKALMGAADASVGGAEALFGIPGSVGGMVYNNAGAFGKSVSDYFISARLYALKDKKVIRHFASDMNFGYRRSMLQSKEHVLLSAEFKLDKIDKEKIRNEFKRIISLRKGSQPYGEKSLGSIFKRCDGIPLSRLIDDLGLKGFRIGGAEISTKHAGFIVNSGGATANDVLRLVEYVKNKIYKEYGIIAEEEIELLK